MDEWLEAEGESVEAAVQAALADLGLNSPDQVTVEVLREPKKGFLGLGAQTFIGFQRCMLFALHGTHLLMNFVFSPE